MHSIVIIGAGGHARDVKFLIEEINRAKPTYEFLGYIVSDLNAVTERDSVAEIIGDERWFERHHSPTNVAIGIGTPMARVAAGRRLAEKHPKLKFPALLHPHLIYDRATCRFERGVQVCASCILTVNVTLKEFAMVNLACTIGHETVIGAGSVIYPNSSLSGGVTIGESVLIGTGGKVLPYLKIGDGATIGAGVVVSRDVPPNVTLVAPPPIMLTKH